MWRVSAARAGATMALRLTLSCHPGIKLDKLTTQKLKAESDLAARAKLLACRASEITTFTPHGEFFRVRAAGNVEVPEDSYELLFDDPEGNQAEMLDEGTGSSSGAYANDDAEMDTSVVEERERSSADDPTT